jgi:hypothetical protein
MKFTSDVDIDFADRTQILAKIKHVPASIVTNGSQTRHNTGIYPTIIPIDPFNGYSSIDYRAAEQRGYIKLDFLNVNVYSQVSSEQHLTELMQRDPPWQRLLSKSFCEQIIHIGNHYDTMMKMPDPIDTIARLAMFLAVIRPAKRHLIGRTWAQVAQTVWDKPTAGEYYFKKSHSVSYAHLCVVHMNLLDLADQGNTTTL